MNITAGMVKELREKTSAGMMDCKKALQETNGDMDAAVSLLREKGIAKAAKKADRIAAEGLTDIYVEGNVAAIIEVNAETDFVAKNEQFVSLVSETAQIIAKHKPVTNEEALALTNAQGKTLAEAYMEATAVIGEKLDFRRFAVIEKSDSESFGAYKHAGSRIAVVTVVENGSEKLAKDLAMHIVAMKPTVLSYTDLDPKFIEDEFLALKGRIEVENEDRGRTGKQLLRVPKYGSELQLTDAVMTEVKAGLEADLKEQGKPEKIWDKILPGQIDKFVKDNTEIDQTYALLSQSYVIDDSKTVGRYLEDTKATVKSFVRFEVGEGIEKRQDNFAEEVMSQLKN